MTKQGWFNESNRHALAAQGIETGTKVPMPAPAAPKLQLDKLQREQIHKEEEEYQGWANRETWAVRLHWDNNANDQNYFYEQAEQYQKANKPVFEFADFLKDAAEQIQEDVFEGHASEEAKSMMQDVGSLWRVDWHELAESYYDDVKENIRYKHDKELEEAREFIHKEQ